MIIYFQFHKIWIWSVKNKTKSSFLNDCRNEGASYFATFESTENKHWTKGSNRSKNWIIWLARKEAGNASFESVNGVRWEVDQVNFFVWFWDARILKKRLNILVTICCRRRWRTLRWRCYADALTLVLLIRLIRKRPWNMAAAWTGANRIWIWFWRVRFSC